MSKTKDYLMEQESKGLPIYSKESLKDLLKETKEVTDGKNIDSDTVIYLILKALELRSRGLTSQHFEKSVIKFEGSSRD